MSDLLLKKLQALLYAEGGVLSFKSLARALSIPESEVRTGLAQLARDLEGSGLALVISDTEGSLVIAEEAREAVVKVLKEDEEKNIGDAGLEILSILLYEGPSTRAQIDYVRGVNSSSTIRTLLLRGLVERSGNPDDGREYIYRATAELLAHLGAKAREDLPKYGIISPELAAFKAGAEHQNPVRNSGQD
ncbi:MAG: SMC-Scp complex subunit ScpB [Minisyncoccia bacterium]